MLLSWKLTWNFIFFRENCYTVPEQKCETVEKEVTTQECADVVKPPVCETVLGEDCYFVTKNTCSQDSEPLPGYESDTLPGNIKDLNFILFLKFVYTSDKPMDLNFFKCDVLAIALLRIKILPSFLPSFFLPLRQNYLKILTKTPIPY